MCSYYSVILQDMPNQKMRLSTVMPTKALYEEREAELTSLFKSFKWNNYSTLLLEPIRDESLLTIVHRSNGASILI